MTARYRAASGPRPRPAFELPAWSDRWALLLDLDGTLARIALSPDDVHVDATLRRLIRSLRKRAHGAVAVISGRPIREIDRLLGRAVQCVAGQHGAERRDATGAVRRLRIPSAHLKAAGERIAAQIAAYDGLHCEWKGLSVALHYRRAPSLAAFAHAKMRAEAVRLRSAFGVIVGKSVVELKPTRASKGHALEAFMCEPPFRGRIPVCIGDDVTDEDAFASALRLGGIAIKVGRGATCASHRLADSAAVRRWIARAAAGAADAPRAGRGMVR
ncbi:MAG: trehalose-phosphatase [Gemmatimonadota bacterium]|nr:trehalose-phosphatase [Gemmatimonadota bacterium]